MAARVLDLATCRVAEVPAWVDHVHAIGEVDLATVEFIERDLGVSRPTATKYLGALEKCGVLRKTKVGRTNFYVNEALFKLLSR